MRYVLQMEAGMTHINDQTVNDLPNAPFGGEKTAVLDGLAATEQLPNLQPIVG